MYTEGPFVNLRIGTSALELELKLKLVLILQPPLFPVPLGLWTPNLAGWWFRIRRPHPQSHVILRYRGHVTNKNVISLFSQGLCTPNLAGWWLRMRGPHLQSHMTHRSRAHVSSQKRFISTLTRSLAPKTW